MLKKSVLQVHGCKTLTRTLVISNFNYNIKDNEINTFYSNMLTIHTLKLNHIFLIFDIVIILYNI